jgi:hypothetical protein
MGYSLSWAALKGGNLQTICSVFDLRSTGKREEIAESNIDGAQLPSGWYLVMFDHNVIEERLLKELSRTGEVVYCFVEDHVMFSSASGWNSGKQIWQVTHDGGEKGILHLETSGHLPAVFESIRKRLFAEQETADSQKVKVDYVYEAPPELAKELTGFRHDEEVAGMSSEAYEILEFAKGAHHITGPLFGFLFGKKDRA